MGQKSIENTQSASEGSSQNSEVSAFEFLGSQEVISQVISCQEKVANSSQDSKDVCRAAQEIDSLGLEEGISVNTDDGEVSNYVADYAENEIGRVNAISGNFEVMPPSQATSISSSSKLSSLLDKIRLWSLSFSMDVTYATFLTQNL